MSNANAPASKALSGTSPARTTHTHRPFDVPFAGYRQTTRRLGGGGSGENGIAGRSRRVHMQSGIRALPQTGTKMDSRRKETRSTDSRSLEEWILQPQNVEA